MDVKGGLQMFGKPAIAGRLLVALVVCVGLSFSSEPAMALDDTDTLRMEIGNVSGFVGELVPIPIYLSTEMSDEDSCGGFDISLSLSRPDLVFFEVDTTTVDTVIEGDPPETTYVDIDTMYICQFDTVGTLASDWDMVNVRSTIGKGLELQLMGMADFMEQGNHAIVPNTSGVLLKIFGRILADVPDTMTDRIVNVDPNVCYYSNTRGALIEPAKNTSGSVEVESYQRGDVNCDTHVNPLDVMFLINRVYRGWQILCNDALGDINCSGGLSPLDVTFLVNYVYKYWPFPDC